MSHHRGRRGSQSHSASPQKKGEALPSVGSSEPLECSGHRLRTSMTRATVEDSTAGLGQTLRSERAVVGGLSAQKMGNVPGDASTGMPSRDILMNNFPQDYLPNMSRTGDDRSAWII